ncbi:MAG: VanZ family protein [Verrucomicrobia bacterium]|nr:VanZ family protein [Verrucomicrobiota bacterium]MBI3870429.1 VanZ family protein [Verrucomicrobiota bacterium]
MRNFSVFPAVAVCSHEWVWFKRNAYKHWLIVLVWILVIFGASSDAGSSNRTSRIIGPIVRLLYPAISDQALDHVVVAVRKTAHVTEYALLALFVWRAIHRSRHLGPPRWSWEPREAFWSWALATAYAGSDEIHQLFVPSRTGQVQDVLIDSFGACLGLCFVWAYCRQRSRGGASGVCV